MEEDKILTVRPFVHSICDAIKDENNQDTRSNMALEAIEQLILRTRHHLTDEARAEACRFSMDMLSVDPKPGLSNERGSVSKKRKVESPKVILSITFRLSIELGIEELTALRVVFFERLLEVEVKPLNTETSKSLKFTPGRAEELADLVFYDFLGIPMKERVLPFIQLHAHSSKESVEHANLTLSSRPDLPLSLQEFTILFDARNAIRKVKNPDRQILKMMLCEVLIYRQYMIITSDIENGNVAMRRILDEQQVIPDVKHTKVFIADLFDMNLNTFDNDITQCQILADLCVAFGYGILIFLSKNSGQLLTRLFRSQRLKAVWPILDELIPDLKNVSEIAAENIVRPVINGKSVHILPDADTDSVESLFTAVQTDLGDNLQQVDSEPVEGLTEETIRRYVLEYMTVVRNEADAGSMEMEE